MPLFIRLSIVLALCVQSLFSDWPDTGWNPSSGYYTLVTSQQAGLLKDALQQTISGQTVVAYSNTDEYMRVIDQDPENADNLILLYSGLSMNANNIGSGGGTVWNREHVFPQSYGTENGPGNSDLHHLFPANGYVNSIRSNLAFDWSNPAPGTDVQFAPGTTKDNDSFEPRDADKGRVARAMLYMDVRYAGGESTPDLKLADRPNSGTHTMGYHSTLLEWNRMFMPDSREKRRNHLIHQGVTWGVRTYRQGNRNPFVDYPELADAIWLPETTTYLNWRYRQFGLPGLDDPGISAHLADPDTDRVPNLAELTLNSDPNDPGSLPHTTLTRNPNGTNLFTYTRIASANLSAITCTIEFSSTPLDPGSWSSFLSTASNTTVTPLDEDTEIVEISDHFFPSDPKRYFRLLIEAGYPVGAEASAVYDPALISAPVGSIFAYDPVSEDGWRQSEWMGPVHDNAFPYVYLPSSGWWYLHSITHTDIWFWNEDNGWLWTRPDIFPNFYQPDSQSWIWFQL